MNLEERLTPEQRTKLEKLQKDLEKEHQVHQALTESGEEGVTRQTCLRCVGQSGMNMHSYLAVRIRWNSTMSSAWAL